MKWTNILEKVGEDRWQLPQTYKKGMRVPGLVFADEAMLELMADDKSLEQVANVAFLPGIVGYSMAMPDVHWGYGFPIGGVAATDADGDGVISPGGVGFDINCGVRLLRSHLTEKEVRPHLQDLIASLYRDVPSGTGTGGRLKLKTAEIEEVLLKGAVWAIERGLGDPEDLEVTEEAGAINGVDVEVVGNRPKKRGGLQLGTLGSGNHFVEVQAVDKIYLPKTASAMGLHEIGQITVMIHTGSRGLGHQVCTDALKTIEQAGQRYGIHLPDRQLASVPISSPEGKNYLMAMRGAANFAWANRQCIAHWTRLVFEQMFGRTWIDMGMRQVYDLSHNMAKIEQHYLDGKQRRLCVHRKGATRCFPAGDGDIPERYRNLGQPVLIPGDMGRYSFVAIGATSAMDLSLGSACHGAGRLKSRTQVKRSLKGRDIRRELADKGIIAMASGWAALAEEAPSAYKDAESVVNITENAGLCRKVVRLKPLGVVKG